MSGWYKVHPMEWDEKTRDLTNEEFGALTRLINLMHRKRGPISDNPTVLSSILNCAKKTWTRIRNRLVGMGFLSVTESGQLTNPDAMDQICAINEKLNRLRATGAAGGKAAAVARRNPDEKPMESRWNPDGIPIPAANPLKSNETGVASAGRDSRLREKEGTEDSSFSSSKVLKTPSWESVPAREPPAAPRTKFPLAAAKRRWLEIADRTPIGTNPMAQRDAEVRIPKHVLGSTIIPNGWHLDGMCEDICAARGIRDPNHCEDWQIVIDWVHSGATYDDIMAGIKAGMEHSQAKGDPIRSLRGFTAYIRNRSQIWQRHMLESANRTNAMEPA